LERSGYKEVLNVMKGDHGEEANMVRLTHDVHEKEGVDM